MATPKVYVICDSNCKYEGMTREQILSAIAQAVNDGEISNIDAGFITKIKELNSGENFSIWVGTQAEYNTLTTIDKKCLYIITDDSEIANIKRDVAAILENGVAYAEKAGEAEYAEKAGAVNSEYIGTSGFTYPVLLGDLGDSGKVLKTGLQYDTKTGTLEGRARTAAHLKNNDGTIFGRATLYKYSGIFSGRQLPSDGSEITININDVSNKFIVVEFLVKTGTTYDSQEMYKVRTPAFNCKGAQKQSVKFWYPFQIDDKDNFSNKVAFFCEDGALKVKITGGNTNAETGNEIYITAIYEEM